MTKKEKIIYKFKLCSFLRHNIHPNIDHNYIRACRYDLKKDPLCPVFVVGDILKICEDNETEIDLMLKKVLEIESIIFNSLIYLLINYKGGYY